MLFAAILKKTIFLTIAQNPMTAMTMTKIGRCHRCHRQR